MEFVEIARHGLPHYRAACRREADSLGWEILGDGGETRYRSSVSAGRRRCAGIAWFFRRFQGRVLHVLRLIKASRTFRGGLDYLMWKIERHSGVKVELSERARRFPLLAGWYALWKVKRNGGFR